MFILHSIPWLHTFLLMGGLFTASFGQSSDPKEVRFPNFTIVTSDDYDVMASPESKGGPVIVTIEIDPWKIGDICTEQMTFEVDVFLRIKWKDPRVTFKSNENASTPVWGIINSTEALKIWKPVINFRNAMGSRGMSFKPGSLNLKFRGHTILMVLRQAGKFHCNFDLSLYPMDVQNCAVEVQALTFKANVLLQDATTVYEFRGGSDPPQFVVYRHSSGPCTRKDGSDKYYSCIEYRFYFRRQIAHHVMMTFIPSSLIVCLTWISFWLDVDATPARVGLGLTSLLTLATHFDSVQEHLPPVSYIKAIDVWMFACIFMVFGSIVEFAVANYTARRSRNVMVVPVKQISTQSLHAKAEDLKPTEKLTTVDKCSRYLFPITFLIFVVSYWSYYGTSDEL